MARNHATRPESVERPVPAPIDAALSGPRGPEPGTMTGVRPGGCTGVIANTVEQSQEVHERKNVDA